MLEEADTIGSRVRRFRLRLGMPQAELATRLGKTQGWLSKVEQGRIELDRAGLINQIAAELHVHPNDLIVRPYAAAPAQNEWRVAAASILRELRRYDLAPVFDGVPRSSEELWAQTVRLHRLRDAAASPAILRALPDFFRESRALAEVSTGWEREEAFGIYAVCCKFAHTAGHALGHPELIAMACERAGWAAQRSGDPLLPAVADWMRVWDMWATADWHDSITLSDKAIRSVQDAYDRGEPLALRLWGTLQLRAAVSCARAANREEAESRIALAQEAGRRVDAYSGPEIFDRHSLTFSSGNAHIHAVSVALDLGDQNRALAIARRQSHVMVDGLPKSRRGQYHLDLAKAWLWDGNRDAALKELEMAEKTASALVRNSPIARSLLRQLVYAERVAARERLRRMSVRFHLDD